jgi:hypothetical protein
MDMAEDLEKMSTEDLEAELKRCEQTAVECLQLYMQYRHFEDREMLKEQIVWYEERVAEIKQEIAQRSEQKS